MTIEVEKRIKLEVREVWCGHYVALPKARWDELQQRGELSFWCPYGHEGGYTESENSKLRKQLAEAQERANAATTREQAARQAQGRAEAAVERGKRRANAGVCPHCHRTFQQVQRHMATKHPEAAP